MQMKKLASACLVLCFLLILAACGSEPVAQAPSDAQMSATTQATSDIVEGEPSSTEPAPEELATTQPMQPAAEETDGQDRREAVVYFSATGNTKAVAQTLAELIDCDVYELVPEEPYTEEDLNYGDETTRATSEQHDPNARPAISGAPLDLGQYETVYVGYPIWWGDMPRILYTFFDAQDFDGKAIAPFCTSGGSGLSGTPGTIAAMEPGATVLDGLSVSASSAQDARSAVEEWLAAIGQQWRRDAGEGMAKQ